MLLVVLVFDDDDVSFVIALLTVIIIIILSLMSHFLSSIEMRGNKQGRKKVQKSAFISITLRNNAATTNTDADSKALAKHHLTREHGNRD